MILLFHQGFADGLGYNRLADRLGSGFGDGLFSRLAKGGGCRLSDGLRSGLFTRLANRRGSRLDNRLGGGLFSRLGNLSKLGNVAVVVRAFMVVITRFVVSSLLLVIEARTEVMAPLVVIAVVSIADPLTVVL